LRRGATVGKGASGVEIWKENSFLWTQNLCGFGHEMNAGKHNHVCIGRRSTPGEVKTVADKIGYILNFGLLVIVSEDNRVQLALKPPDLTGKFCERWNAIHSNF
jgi:hypothetical protein